MEIIHGLVGLFSLVLAVNSMTLQVNLFWLSLVITGLVVYGFTCIGWSVNRLTKPDLYYPPDIHRMRLSLTITIIGMVGTWYVN